MPVTVRPAKAADLPAIVSLLEDAGLPLEGLGETTLWVAEAAPGQHPVGVVGLELHGGEALLRSLSVLDYRRGKGVGRQLVEHALAEAAARGVVRVHVLTTDAAAFFEDLGFATGSRGDAPSDLAKSSEFTGACPDTATMLVRSTT